MLSYSTLKHSEVTKKDVQPVKGMDMGDLVNMLKQAGKSKYLPDESDIHKWNRGWLVNVSASSINSNISKNSISIHE